VTELQHVDLFNVAELPPVPGRGGAVRLSRFPKQLEPKYRLPGGKRVSAQSTGCELRLVPEERRVVFHLSSPNNATVHAMQGDFWLSSQALGVGQVHEFEVVLNDRVSALSDEARAGCRFGRDVLRLGVEGGTVYVHGLDTLGFAIRKPEAEELPAKRWLAYGSSITQSNAFGYAHQAGDLLGFDVLNKGMSGSCAVEPETAEFLVNQCEWDVASLEWGINMRGTVSVDEFTRRVDTALPMFVQTGRPIFVITVLRNDVHLGQAVPEVAERQAAYDVVLRERVAALREDHPNVHLIEGADVLAEAGWLTADLVHPTRDGHVRMGERLAALAGPALGIDAG